MSLNTNLFKNVISMLLILLGAIMLPTVLVSYFYSEINLSVIMLIISSSCFLIGGLTFYKSDRKVINATVRDGYFMTFISWLILVIISALPYYFACPGIDLIDSIFESAAGWSTTSAYVTSPGLLTEGLVFWKATTNWFGGIGMIILIVSITPYFNVTGKKLSDAEAPGPTLEKMSTKFTGTARYLYYFYFIITLAEIIMLKSGGLSMYDAVINSFSGVSTAGLHFNPGGITSQLTPYIKGVIVGFSFLGAMNFGIYFFIFKRRFKDIAKDLELRVYLIILIVSTVIISASVAIATSDFHFYNDIFPALSMTVSFFSTSGYSFYDYSIWPTIAKIILISAMFIGSCSISTGGGIKVSRIIVFYKLILRGIYKRIHPHGVKPVQFFNKPISVNNVNTITVYVLLYFVIFLIGSLLLSLNNLSIETTLSATLGAMSNTGISFGELANVPDYSIFAKPCRLLLSIIMVGGRLEFYAILLMFTQSFWNVNKVN